MIVLLTKLIGGNITDKALLSFAGQNKKDTIKIIDKIMFNSQNKYSISIIEKNNKKIKTNKRSTWCIIKVYY